MKITIEFNNVEEYLEFKEKTAQEEQVQEQFITEINKKGIYLLRNGNSYSIVKQTFDSITVELH